MARGISRRTRAEAIFLLDVAACYARDVAGGRAMLVAEVAQALGTSPEAEKLAWAAYLETDDTCAEDRAEAAAMLREGWTLSPFMLAYTAAAYGTYRGATS